MTQSGIRTGLQLQDYQSLQQQNAAVDDVCMSSMHKHSVCRRREFVLSASSVLAGSATSEAARQVSNRASVLDSMACFGADSRRP